MKPLSRLFAPCFLMAAASAQVAVNNGISPEVTNLLDFEIGGISTGPIANNAPVFAAGRIDSVERIGSWFGTTDVISPGANDSGKSLVVGASGFEIAEIGDFLHSPDSGAGIAFNLSDSFNSFGLLFVDQRNFEFTVELFAGPISLGSATSTYGPGAFPVPAVHFRGSTGFDRVEITFPNGTSGVGFDNLHVGTGLPPQCVETLTTGTSSTTGTDGAVYFDLQSTGLAIFTEIETKFLNSAGQPAGLEVYTTSGSYVGKENDPSAWELAAVDNGLATTATTGLLTRITFQQILVLPAGVTGIALVGRGGMRHGYTPAANTSSSADGTLTVTAGASTVAPFQGSVFSPRSWNGRLCRVQNSVGSTYCSSTVNSTGQIADLTTFGSSTASVNDLTLAASRVPVNTFGQFLCSQTQGFVPGAGGSQGNLCILGAIGRLVGGGVVQAGPDGRAQVRADLTMLPQPTQFVVAMAGESWNFQFWFRDMSGGVNTSNYSNARNVLFD